MGRGLRAFAGQQANPQHGMLCNSESVGRKTPDLGFPGADLHCDHKCITFNANITKLPLK